MSHIPPISATTQLIGLMVSLVATMATGAVGAIASVSAASFYGSLSQPVWAPPAWLFGPVWSLLYVLMGISAWLVWRRHGFKHAATALSLFAAQLVANALWTWLFFYWRLGGVALAEILLLGLLIAGTIYHFWKLDRTAAALLVPYLAWVGFAAVLNLVLWQLNPDILG